MSGPGRDENVINRIGDDPDVTATDRASNRAQAFLSGIADPAPAISPSRDLAAVALLSVLIALKGWERAHFNEWMARVDILGQYLPWWAYLGEGLRSFDIPGWNPHQFAGTPFLGDPQSGWMYLPIMAVFTFLPPLLAMKAYVFVHLFIGGLSMYALARVLGIRPIGAFVASVAFVFGPFIHHTTYCCNIQAHVAAWLPAGLLGVELALRSRTWGARIAWLALGGFAIAQMIAGWIGQGAYIGLIVIGAYVAYRTLVSPPAPGWTARDRGRALVVHGLLVLALGLGLGAAAALPRLEVNGDTNLSGGNYANVEDEEERDDHASLERAVSWLVEPRTVVDSLRSTGRATAIGAATLALAVIGLLTTRRAPAPFFLGMTLVTIVLVLDRTLLHELFYLLPRFEELHEHAELRSWAVLMIGPSILAGIGVDRVAGGGRPARLLAAALALTPLVWMLRFLLPSDLRHWLNPTYPLFRTALVVSLVCGAVAALAIYHGRSPRWLNGLACAALALLLLWEPAGREALQTLREPPSLQTTRRAIAVNTSSTDPGGAGEFLQNARTPDGGPYRYFGYDARGVRTARQQGIAYQSRRRDRRYQALLLTARPIRLGIYDIQGYNPVQLQNIVDIFLQINRQPLDYHDAVVLPEGLDSPWLDLLGARYIVVPADVPPGRPDLLHLSQRHPTLFASADARVLERTTVFPRAWVVHRVETVPGTEAHALIEHGVIDPATTATIAPGTEAGPLEPADSAVTETVAVTGYERDRVTLRATLSSAGLVVLSELNATGWTATVDGESHEIVEVNGGLRGVFLPAGEHTVVLRYAPRSVPLGLAISAGVLLAAAGAALGLRGRPVGWPAAPPAPRRA